jgi:hypothetical protein
VGPAGAAVLGAWDFDRDGRMDLLLRTDGEVRVARNAGGSFVVGPPLSTGSVTVGDFDGDRPDLVLSGIPSLPALVFRNVCGNPREVAAPGPAVPVRPRTRP